LNLFDGYRYLAALEQHRHFGRAAAACHITQPALSNALRSLEAQLGTAIVRRGRQYEGLTAEGERVLSTAHRVLHEQELLAQDLASTQGLARGRLVIGSVPTAVPLAARFAARLIEHHPGLRPTLRSLSSQDIESGLDRLAIDLALGYTGRLATGAQAPLQAWPQVVEHYHLLQRCEAVGGGLRFEAPIGWAEAAAQPLALLGAEMHNRAILDSVFQGLQLHVQPALETNSVLALLVAVQSGTLAAVLPGALVSTLTSHSGLQARPLVAPVLRMPIGFITARVAQASRALQAALALARDPAWLAEAAAHSGPLASAAQGLGPDSSAD
jgi:DNA-binding transcriptional LysR family regulator